MLRPTTLISPVTGKPCLAAFQQAEDALAEVRILSKQIQQEQQAVDSAQTYLKLEQARYDTGIDPYVDVLIAQTTLLADQQTLNNLQVQRDDLRRSAGGGPWRRLGSLTIAEPSASDTEARQGADGYRAVGFARETEFLPQALGGWQITLPPLYSRGVHRSPALGSPAPHRSPTPKLFLGLIITLAAVVVYSGYITRQISGLRELQNNLVDRNRKDSLQLLRIQNDLNSLALAMRDMLDNDEPYPLTAWSAQFQRVRTDLDDALRRERQVAPVNRTPEQEQYLENSVAQFWDAADRTFALAQDAEPDRGENADSNLAAGPAGSAEHGRVALAGAEQRKRRTSGAAHRQIYDRVQRQVYLFLTATLIAILFTSLYLIRSNRRLFAQLAALSEQRSELAQKLIATQESTLRHISRELHDEFGQILTAVGAMLTRAGKSGPGGIAAARRTARSLRDYANHAGQSAQPVAGFASGDAGRNRTGEHARLVFAGGGTAGGNSAYSMRNRANLFPWMATPPFMCIAWCRKL